VQFRAEAVDGEEKVMARSPRRDLVDATEVGVYHCVQRAVRRAWLCGQDPVTGKNFDHRNVWIQERLAFLAGQFSIDICAMAIMSNHIHLIVRNQPNKRGQIPAELLPILQRLRLSSETWVETVLNFGRWFRLAAGRVDSLAAEAARRGRRWLQGVRHSRAAFA